MTTDYSDNDKNPIGTALDAGIALAGPTELIDGARYAFVVPDGGQVQVIDNDLDQFRDRPRRKTGKATLHTATAFIAYLGKHGLPETEIWADVASSRITAVINAHHGIYAGEGTVSDKAGWGDHRATLALQHTPSWLAWTARNSKLGSQLDFAEHLEDYAGDVRNPNSATMLEIAQTFTANRKIDFDSSQRLSSGEVQLRWHEEIDAKAGRKGDISIPERFELALQPYEGSPAYKIQARLRYRITDGRLAIGYALDRPDEALRIAFTDVTDQIAQETERQVWHGTPTN